jgi:predicted 3-demethylubiquinone-9 3-methyltransferase (glyoxalase superfamily)
LNKITPLLWLDNQAEEAVNYDVFLLNNAGIDQVTRYGNEAAAASGQPAGSVMTIAFRLGRQPFVALNGGPVFRFTEAVSFIVSCDDQEEVNRMWEGLSAAGWEARPDSVAPNASALRDIERKPDHPVEQVGVGGRLIGRPQLRMLGSSTDRNPPGASRREKVRSTASGSSR